MPIEKNLKSRNMVKFFIVMAMLLGSSVASAENKQITSPDGKLVVTVADMDGRPSYSVSYDNVLFLKPSPLGMIANIGDFSSGMSLEKNVSTNKIDETYELASIKKSKVHYVANEAVFSFTQQGKTIYDVIFRISNNDVAFKYRMYPQGETLSCVIKKEATGFAFPDGTITFLCPQSKPMGGFARTSPSYETSYTADDVAGKNGWGEGYTFPCLFRNGDNGWVLVSETGVNGGYCASRLLGHKEGVYTIGFPQEGEANGNGTVSPGIALPGETPWRTITVGKTLAPIVETTVPFDVVKPLYQAKGEYTYGRGSWSWIIGMDGSTNYKEQLRYIDFSAAMGYQSVLVDALWDKQIGRDKIEELAKYGKNKGVALYLWYNSNGYWNDAPQTPRSIMDNAIARRKEMKWMQSIGIRGIKVDFFGGDKQMTMQLYEDILSDANEYGLLVIFHGCTLPRGWERMYPNFASSEAVLASENLHFSQGSCDNEAFNATLHPFIRNTVGSMDFGGSALNKYYNADNAPRGSRRVTSDVYALATAVLFQSPVQHFALAPNNLTDAPSWAIDFMKEVPTTWDEVRFIDGYPGKYVILARRHGDKWYIAGVNAQKETLKLKVNLPMFSNGEKVRLFSDDKALQGGVKQIEIGKKQELQLAIPCNGGVLITR
ncbi:MULTISPECIES: glycoside hydrolase family 97 protein [unclassified Bacteroides]|uniref:glycoside hydrolase family 97 protein n=1 Tax=unclassified Bacteroides TaxID=2646097 RepID=UPI001C3777B7|nr:MULTISPECIES: glycoside hydrolase family 97 protein [unclassified Bacteroides]MBV3655526.1 glycoside hydrolase family 97 protein [Bacteroides sp. MSK.18.91]MBV3666660.1 glycoside hydrolase family 97 protein [Bacteroides sp. MSK.18.83]MBV3711049.1 glycoside hydrolase family 97 protein [Bacteroides sp. MSK.18.39]MBV3737494.1 glycoside hydrolase family 97 protein [Bacteroides sp. MSK.18.37]MBV3752908.1 glycoside hydrolase family 97 protein [Bacteroides sp. MSK.18.22]